MSHEKGGYFISFEPARRRILRDAARDRDKFSVELSIADWSVDAKEMFLVSLSDDKDAIDFAAFVRRKGGPHNTGGHNVEFSGFINLNSLHVSQLLGRLSPKARATVKEREGTRGRYFPPQAWGELMALIKEERPALVAELDAMWTRVVARDQPDREARIQKFAMQRDALGLSLDIAGLSDLRRDEFRKARPFGSAGDAQSFIDLMDGRRVHERTLMENDRSLIEGAMGERRPVSFSSGQRLLRVWIVDKEPIEKFAGIDLVVVNREYGSLLLLQYKCMEQEGASSKKHWRYRPDDKFHEQVALMRKTREAIERLDGEIATERVQDIRLDKGVFYFKFCKRLPLSEQDGELGNGLVMSLDHTMSFLSSEEARGKEKGLYIGYENCVRYLSNTHFVDLARDGWIGGRAVGERHFRLIMGEFEAKNTSLMVAEASVLPDKDASQASSAVEDDLSDLSDLFS